MVGVANGVVSACFLNPIGANMYAMDVATGQINWSCASGSSCIAGKKLFAFTPNGG